MSELQYPLKKDGSLLSRGSAIPKLPKTAPHASQPGSVHWSACLIYGGPERFVQLLESIVAGQGQLAEQDWQRFCVIYREWQRQRRAGELSRDPNLNDVTVALKINAESFFAGVSQAVSGLFTKIALLKASEFSIEAVDLTREAMKDLEKGGADRERMLKLAGLSQAAPGLVVNNVNQVGVKVQVETKVERLAGPLMQFRDTVEEIDENVRTEAVVRAALPPASMEGVVDESGFQSGIRSEAGGPEEVVARTVDAPAGAVDPRSYATDVGAGDDRQSGEQNGSVGV